MEVMSATVTQDGLTEDAGEHDSSPPIFVHEGQQQGRGGSDLAVLEGGKTDSCCKQRIDPLSPLNPATLLRPHYQAPLHRRLHLGALAPNLISGVCWRLPWLERSDTFSSDMPMAPLICNETVSRVSSVLNRDAKQFGKKHMFDGSEETCWNSDQGSSQWVMLEFPQTVKVSQLQIQFQGGFASQLCTLEGKAPPQWGNNLRRSVPFIHVNCRVSFRIWKGSNYGIEADWGSDNVLLMLRPGQMN
ncbi:hypothetical protein KIL84_008662 [Mauremys mutica]|uniref:Nuclear receptor 2C2-associated protein n=1 Tax=Mauremys mutica TaxID=74926 RepID=A0A9D3X853_9SAUR|nr:hypothetical protein KIL84_008662 [Mauremys mutica]